jgi:hypothetical protein
LPATSSNYVEKSCGSGWARYADYNNLAIITKDFCMDKLQRYRFVCTLTFGDVYGQIIAWLVVLLISLAAAMALMGARQPLYALVSVGLVLVLSLPFLLFAFVTTLVNHIEFQTVDPQADERPTAATVAQGRQQPAQATS